MKILIVSSNLSHPTDAGNRVAIMGQVQLLLNLGCEVHFLYADMALHPADDSEMRKYWKEKYHVFHLSAFQKGKRILTDYIRRHFNNNYWKCDDHYPNGIEKYVEKLHHEHRFDAVIIQYIRLSKLLTNTTIPKKAIYTHDVFSYKDLKVGAPFYEACNAHQEAIALQRCPNIFAIQEEEATFYHFLAPQSTIYTVYSSYNQNKQDIVGNNTVLFLASRMEFNINGIRRFIKEVWPLVLQQKPDAKLLIGGSVCEEITDLAAHSVKLLGQVGSLESFYKQGDIVINPVFQGSGLKIKTFEAISFGKVVIVDPHSTIGIFNKEEAPLLIASSVKEWANHICQTLGNISRISSFKKTDDIYIEKLNKYILEPYRSFLKLSSSLNQ